MDDNDETVVALEVSEILAKHTKVTAKAFGRTILDRQVASEKYEVGQEIARGGMGAILRAEDRDLQRLGLPRDGDLLVVGGNLDAKGPTPGQHVVLGLEVDQRADGRLDGGLVEHRHRAWLAGAELLQVDAQDCVVPGRAPNRNRAQGVWTHPLPDPGIVPEDLRRAWAEQRHDPETRALLEADGRHFLHQSLSTPCLDVIVKAEGIWIEDRAGRRYMDFHGNSAHHIGYGHPRLIAALKDQLDDLAFAPRRFTSEPAIALAAKLGEIAPGTLS